MGKFIAFFIENNASLSKPLIVLLVESNQEVSSWHVKYVTWERPSVQGGDKAEGQNQMTSGPIIQPKVWQEMNYCIGVSLHDIEID